MIFRKMLYLSIPVLLGSNLCFSQIMTGSIVGNVVDPIGLAVPEATVILTEAAHNWERTATTDTAGRFVVSSLEPGEYLLTVRKDGFKNYEKKNLRLATGERVSVGDIALELGAVTETVSVTAEVTPVKTESAERADVITTQQVDNLLILGRNIPSMVALLPGVVMTRESEQVERRTDFHVQGNRRTMNTISIDGVAITDIPNAFAIKLAVSQEAVAEVKILTSNYQAEYGQRAGANLNIITKSGTAEFHGLFSYFKRHEQFNANSFFNNRTSQPKPRYRFNTYTYTIGGPIYIPEKFNRNRNKLFFFWAQEFWPNKQSTTVRKTMPTVLERIGDFSQSIGLDNKLITIKDPYSNGQPFPGNIIPPNALSSDGNSLLNVFDEPNFFDRSISKGKYNYVVASERNLPHRMDTLRVDYNINANNLLFATFDTFEEEKSGALGVPAVGQNTWPQIHAAFKAHNKGLPIRYTRIINPNLINEFHFSWFANPEDHSFADSELQRNMRSNVGFNAGQLNPNVNPEGLIPDATFGGVPGAARLRISGRFPINDPYNLLSWSDKISLMKGSHNIKAGIYIDRFWIQRGHGVSRFGSFNFGRNVNNPLDTGYAYANTALGVFNNYTEHSKVPYQRARGGKVEFFVQDNWRATNRLTFDYGARFYCLPPTTDVNDLMAAFAPDRFDPSQEVQLIQPGFDAKGKRAGIHPKTGEVFPTTTIGAIAPGIGDPANGMALASDPDYPRGLIKDQGILFGPRFGFAYDPFGKGRTAVRGGFGIFYTPHRMSTWQTFTTYPPLLDQPVLYYGELSTFLGSSGFVFPTGVQGFSRDGKIPTVMNWSLSIQQNVGFHTVVDIGYVGNVGRHLLWQRDINPVALGANFDPSNVDPTRQGKPLPNTFLRPRTGYSSIGMMEAASSSNYHSLQVTANRRFARGLGLGLSWTWSKSMGFNNDDSNSISPLVDPRIWNYGPLSYDRTHVVKINYVWSVPDVSVDNQIARQILNGWQVSGITSFISGQPLGVGFSTTKSVDITGTSSLGPRIVVTGNPNLPKSERTFEQNFRTDVFALPAKGTFGNAANTLIRGPGVNNWDIAVFKNFPIHETARIQFRWELYNAFNHTQFSGLDTAARFDPATGEQVNSRFGQFTSAHNPRLMQFALRFLF